MDSIVHYRVLIALLLMAATTGCSSVKDSSWFKLPLEGNQNEEKKAAKRPAGIPKLEVAGQNLGESQEVGLSQEEFVRSVVDLLDAQREVSASRWIARHPDATVEFLRKSGEQKLPPATLLFIARVHDRQTIRSASGASWEHLQKMRLQTDSTIAGYDRARTQFLTLLAQGQVEKAQQLQLGKIASEAKHALLQIDAAQLQGTAALLAERPAEAAAELQRGVEIAQQVSDYQCVYLQLLWSDAQRRAGDAAAAATTWLTAVNTAVNLLDSQRPCTDPVLWERLAYLRPVNVPWPEPMVTRLQCIDPLISSSPQNSPSYAEASLWNCIGRWYLERSHHQAALVAFKRAEAAVNDPATKQFLRFRQARALVLLDQAGPATAILVSLANDTTSPMARPAMALLGSMRLQTGQSQQGLHLLRKALEANDGVEWLERTDAEADLALALLLIGDEQQGFQWLHRAQQRFEKRDEFESLALSLFNEANYLAEHKKQAEADAIRERLKVMERLN